MQSCPPVHQDIAVEFELQEDANRRLRRVYQLILSAAARPPTEANSVRCNSASDLEPDHAATDPSAQQPDDPP